MAPVGAGARRWAVGAAVAVLCAVAVADAAAICASDLDCSLAGACVDGKCVCDGWSEGDYCEILSLAPADADRPGYRNSSGYHSWGGASIQDPETGKWFLFVSQIAGKCPLLGYWSQLSEVVRLVSYHGPLGPWEFDTVVLPTFAHNVKPYIAPDGTFLLYYIGQPNGANTTCQGGLAPDAPANSPIHPHTTAGPIYVASAPSMSAAPSAFKVTGPLTDSVDWHSATNPSVVFNPNGTVTMCVSRGWSVGSGFTKTNMLMNADSWAGPFHNLTNGSYSTSIHSGEDPDIWRSSRGWHMLNHNDGLAATRMWVSLDGTVWRPALGEDAFTASVTFTNGTTRPLCWRQRPQVVMAEDGLPGWLWTGVQDGGHNCEFTSANTLQSWTLVQTFRRASP